VTESPLRTLNSSDEMRVLFALLLQPVVAAGLAFVSFPLLNNPGTVDSAGAATSIAFVVGIVAFVFVLAAAWPAVLWLAKRGPVKLTHAMLFGVAMANVPVAIGGSARAVLFASFIGLVSAVLFWVISIRGTDLARDLPRPLRTGEIEFE